MYDVYAIRYATFTDRRSHENFIQKDVHDGLMPLESAATANLQFRQRLPLFRKVPISGVDAFILHEPPHEKNWSSLSTV
jgi:hypothetical protein